jgi:hypothetical protein
MGECYHDIVALSKSVHCNLNQYGFGFNARGSRVRFPAGAGNFSRHHRCVHNGSGAHPTSYPIGTGVSFSGGKLAVA